MSFSIATGRTRSSTNWRTVSWIARCSSVSSKSTRPSLRPCSSQRSPRSRALVSLRPRRPRLGLTAAAEGGARRRLGPARLRRGVGGVIVQGWNIDGARPSALVFVDQEGGKVSAFRSLPPARPASRTGRSAAAPYASGRATGVALRGEGVDVDLAPVLDLRNGPLGSRHFARPPSGSPSPAGSRPVGWVRAQSTSPGSARCPISTDDHPYVRGRVRGGRSRAVPRGRRRGVPCVMAGHGVYPSLGTRRATLEPATYRLLHELGFDGVAITDSSRSSVRATCDGVGGRGARARRRPAAVHERRDAARAIRVLVPLARRASSTSTSCGSSRCGAGRAFRRRAAVRSVLR